MPNQQTNQPTGLNPPVIAPPVDLPPLPPDISSQGSPAQSVSQSDATTGATDQPTSPVGPTPPGDSSIISSSPKKKFGGGKIIATILGVLLLVGGVGAGIYLTQQRQIFEEKAYVTPRNTVCRTIRIEAYESPRCGEICESGGGRCEGTNDIGSTYSTTYTLTNVTNEAHTVAYGQYSYYCPSKKYGDGNRTCMENNIESQETVTLEPGQTKTIKITRDGLLRKGQSCGTYQTDLIVWSIDGNDRCSYGPRVTSQGWGICMTGRACNTSLPTPTPSPSPTPTPPPGSGQCTGVFAASSSGAVLTDAQLTALTPGTEVYFCTRSASSGGSFDKVQFKVGDTVYPEIILGSINPPPSGNVSISSGSGGTGDLAKCQKYQIKAADKTVNVKAKLHHTVSGWVGETF
jgi:hypothetical protein